MIPLSFPEILTLVIVVVPVLAMLLLGALFVAPKRPSERFVSGVTTGALSLVFLSVLALVVDFQLRDVDQVIVHFGSWFTLDDYHFPLEFLVDGLSLPFLLLTVVLTGLVARFSSKYLHRDPGFQRFFFLLLLFASSMILLVLAGSIDLLFAGWEMVGLASVLLIAFFDRRREPIRNALRTFAIYRWSDVGLLAAVVLVHHYAQTSTFGLAWGQEHWPSGRPRIEGAPVHFISLLLLLAAMGKSAQVPFGGWLPRAMEGPTPSSAIFYGGISIHAGAYLLLRAAPLIDRSPTAKIAIFTVGLLTALYGTMVGRVQSDAKNQLAYAAMGQVGLIFVEIALGLRFLALLHIAGHASVRTLQFLRAPSVLQEFHRIQAGKDGEVGASGLHYELLLPARVRQALYSWALVRGGVESAVERYALAPFMSAARSLENFEQRWTHHLDRGEAEEPPERVLPQPSSLERKVES